MKKVLNSIFHPKKSKLFWLYFSIGALILILSFMLMPIWASAGKWCFFKSWGTSIINIIICAFILMYLFFFLLKKITKKSNGTIKALTIIEFVILALIAVGCVLQQFKIINIGGACSILGLALWCRGTTEVFRAYYHQKEGNDKYPIWWLCISIVFLTLGVYLFANPIFQDIHLLWAFDILLVMIAATLIVVGCCSKPIKKK